MALPLDDCPLDDCDAALAPLWDMGYRLTYAEIDVVDPDAPHQHRVVHWRDLDHAPDFPVLNGLLTTWQRDGVCTPQSIRIATLEASTPAELIELGYSLQLH